MKEQEEKKRDRTAHRHTKYAKPADVFLSVSFRIHKHTFIIRKSTILASYRYVTDAVMP